MEEIFWSVCSKIFGVPCLGVKEIKSIYTKIISFFNLFLFICLLFCFFKFISMLTCINLIQHYYEISLENTLDVELRAVLFYSFFNSQKCS